MSIAEKFHAWWLGAIALLLVLFAATPAMAQDCQIESSAPASSWVSRVTQTNTTVIAAPLATISCSPGQGDVTGTYMTTVGGTLTSGANAIPYSLCTSAACPIDYLRAPEGAELPSTLLPGTKARPDSYTYELMVVIPPLATAPPGGIYEDKLQIWVYLENSLNPILVDQELTLTLNVEGSCEFSAPEYDLDFVLSGAPETEEKTASTTLGVICSLSSGDYSLTAGGGTHMNLEGTSRRMRLNGSNDEDEGAYLDYGLYHSDGSTPWGGADDSPINSTPIPITGSGDVTIVGRIPKGQPAAAGEYSDIVILELEVSDE